MFKKFDNVITCMHAMYGNRDVLVHLYRYTYVYVLYLNFYDTQYFIVFLYHDHIISYMYTQLRVPRRREDVLVVRLVEVVVQE